MCLLIPVSMTQQAMASQTLKPLEANLHWLDTETFVWSTPYSEEDVKTFDLRLVSRQHTRTDTASSRREYELEFAGRLSPDSQAGRDYPELVGQVILKARAAQDLKQRLKTLIKSQLVLQVGHRPRQQANGWLPPELEYYGLQNAKLLDQFFAYQGPLGFYRDQGQYHLRLWAPTAQSVKLLRFDQKLRLIETLPMDESDQGTWYTQADTNWLGQYYQFEVTVFSPQNNQWITSRVSDPYSVSLSANSSHSQMIDLESPEYMPKDWQSFYPPQKQAPEDMVIYELHLRDFSAREPRIPTQARGKYTAFQTMDSLGMSHLKGLASAGLTHVHFLPLFDFASVPETPEQQVELDIPTSPADSTFPQSVLAWMRPQDAYNWGYDPYHYGVPEGSYSTEPQGAKRILEFRQMVQQLARLKLGVILDVVYNHTHSAGQEPQSVFDKIVPGYYYRLDAHGKIQYSTCCPDTASEHLMMQKLMVDTLVRWARAYKITGFRFDLMGHHTRQNLMAVRHAIDQLTLQNDGIDGKAIYLYGEGWKFGSLDAIASDQAMHQQVAAGTGIGTFNDRLRDSARGGNFDHASRSDQGWLSGLYYLPNQSPWNTDTPAEPEKQKHQLANYTDLICLGMAGGLKDFLMSQTDGKLRAGKDHTYRGSVGAAYTQDPQESINYVSAHDNYSLWDQIAAKAPFAEAGIPLQTSSPQLRMEMQMLGIASVLLGQGVPFLDAGIEMLRSKSGDGDSYDSGDWFNALDWSYQSNGWGKGLPPAWRNQKEWDFWRPRLSQTAFKADQPLILAALAQTHRLLKIRQSSPLLRLQTAAAIQNSVRFLQVEAQAPTGVIVLHIRDPQDRDPDRQGLMVILNPLPEPVIIQHPVLAQAWQAVSVNGQPVLQSPHALWVNGSEQEIPPMSSSQFKLKSSALTVPARGIVVLEQAQTRVNP